MELRHLRYFCVVAEELNLTRASERLYIAQPPLTRQVRQLEEEVGTALFHREPRGLRLTPAGKVFLERARQILSRVESAVDTTRRVAESEKTIFGVGFVPSVFYGQLPTLIRRVRQNANVEFVLLELLTLQQVQALKGGRIDIGFGRIRIDDPEVEQEMLFDEPVLAALPAGHPLAGGRPTLAELAEFPLIGYPASAGPNFGDIMLGVFRQNGLSVNVIQVVNDVQTAIGLVAAEMGFTLVPEQVSFMPRRDVSYVRLADPGVTSPVLCCRRKEPPSDIMMEVNEVLYELVENRLTGRYP